MPETLDECLERVQMMADGDPTWDLSDNDTRALKAALMEIIHLREQIHDLREAISPGRIGKPENTPKLSERTAPNAR